LSVLRELMLLWWCRCRAARGFVQVFAQVAISGVGTWSHLAASSSAAWAVYYHSRHSQNIASILWSVYCRKL